jgi:hypothetical protein
MYFATGAAFTAAINALPTSLTGTYKAFDAFYYADKYMSTYSGSLSPVEHFVQIGAARGNQPSASFNPAYYQSTYSDLANLDAADLVFHYVKFGLNEGRAGNAALASYNWSAYLSAYPDVAKYVADNLASFGGSTTNGAIAHYVKFGEKQGFSVPGSANGLTISLSAGTDTRTGTSGNDTFDAGLTTSSLQTLNSGDRLDGGAGTDELFAVVTGSVTPASIANIENVSITAITNAATVDLTNTTGLKSYTNLASTVTQTTTGVSMSTAVTVADTTVDQTVTYVGTSGSSDAATISVRNVVNATADSLTVAGIETLTLDTSGTTNTLGALSSAAGGAVTAGVGMTTSSASTVIVNASGTTVTLGTLGSTVKTLDASKASASTSVTAQFSSTSDLSVTGGAGNDTFHLGSAAGVDTVSAGLGNDTVRYSQNWTTADVVDGGDGTDTIEFVTAADAVVASAPTTYKTTGFETVSVTSQLANATYTAATISATATRFNITGRTSASGVNESTAAALTTGAPTIVGPAGTFTVGLGNASQSTNTLGALAHELTVTDTGLATNDVLTITNSARVLNGAQVGVYGNQNIVIGGYETVTIDTGSISGTYQNLGTVTITGDLASDTTLKFSGANSVEAGVITATNVDASGITAAGSGSTNSTAAFFMVTNSTARNVTGSGGMDVLFGHGTLGSTISGGAGNDSITGGALNDSILGGDGDDSINGGAGNSDLIDGGAGNDTITISANANLTELDTVSGGDGTADVLDFSGAAITSSASTFQTITGFEVLKMVPGAASTISMSDFVNNQGFTRVDYGDANGNAIALNNAPLTVTNIRLITGVDSVTFDRLIDNTSNAVTITARGSGTATVPTLTIDDEETVTFTSFASTDDTTITNAIAAADLKSLTVTGAGDLISATAATSTLIATVDASTSTGAVTLNFGNAAVAITANGGAGVFTFTGGAVGDIITGLSANDVLAGGLGADTINGGAGDDAITGGAGADVMNVGSGTDTIVLGAGTSSTSYGTATGAVATSVAVTGADVITGMAAGDILTLTSSSVTAFATLNDVAANGTMVAAAATSGTLAQNAGNLIRGSWVAGSTTGSGTFVVNTAAGADTLYVYDSDAAQGAAAYQAVVLVGTAGVGGTHTVNGAVISLTLS